MADILNILDTDEFKPIVELTRSIMNLDDSIFTEATQESFIGMIKGALTPAIKNESITELINSFERQNLSRDEAQLMIDTAKESFIDYIESLNPPEVKRDTIHVIFDTIFEIFDEAMERFHKYSIVLPIQLEENAQTPTYAHDTDAAADLYARETVVVPAHSTSNKINTGVHIGLPEGWLAHIAPRSSIGAKTPLRLSNMLGVIDSSYRGPLIVMFDNISDFDYTINAGDRIAQLWITPSYRFKAQIVNELDETDRGQGGLGSTGK